MNKIQITPAWKDVKPSGNYVYRHRRSTDGSVFYVGRGTLRRAWASDKRRGYWRNTALKYGVTVEIVKDDMSLDCSKSLEIILIGIHRLSGDRIVNISDGGESASGFKWTKEQRKSMSLDRGGKSVFCSNGMNFDSANHAARWVSELRWIKSSNGPIASCCKSRQKTAYGFSWSYEGVPNEPISVGVKSRLDSTTKAIGSSDGKTYESAADAARQMIYIGHERCRRGSITRAVRTGKILYGMKWFYAQIP